MYEREGQRLWRALFLYCRDPEIASDAVAEAFAQALRRGSAIKSHRRWIWRASFRIAAGELKARGRLSPHLPELSYEMPEPAVDLARALVQLSPMQRGAALLHFYAGYSLRESARILGTTPAAVGVHLTRARRRLRGLLSEGGG